MSEIEKLNMIAEWQEQHKQLIQDLDNSKKRIEELEAQIEKMKCWCNCKNYTSCLVSFEKGICYNCKKWELRR